MKVRVKTILYLCSVVWCLGAATVSAQTAEAVLTGRVSADDAEVVPSAIVRLKEIRRHAATDARDNVKTLNAGSQQTNLTYGTRLPNLPYLYAGTDMALTWPNIDRRGGKFSLTYDNLYQHSFPLYAENLGSKDSKEMVPEQFATISLPPTTSPAAASVWPWNVAI